MRLADLAEERAGERISFADTQVQPRAVITSPEWSGSETGGRRYSPFVVNVERKKPWHTLTGRMHFFLDHDWIAEYGEALPTYRPPLDYVRHFGEQGLREERPAGDHGALPDPALEVVDPLRVPGQPAHAAAVPRRPGDLDEPCRRRQDRRGRQRLDRGATTATAWSSAGRWSRHRMPEGTVFMYHAKDRHLMTPKSEVSGWHGGGDNSLTRLVIKPTHMIGGYAPAVLRVQLLRAHRQPARRDHRHPPPRPGGRVLMRVMAQMSMVMNLDKCIGCHTCTVTCKQVWTNRPGHRVRVLQQRGDQAGRRLSEAVRGPGAVARRLDARQARPAAAQGGRAAAQAADDLLQPGPADDRRLRRPVDLRLPDPHPRPARHAATPAPTRSPR